MRHKRGNIGASRGARYRRPGGMSGLGILKRPTKPGVAGLLPDKAEAVAVLKAYAAGTLSVGLVDTVVGKFLAGRIPEPLLGVTYMILGLFGGKLISKFDVDMADGFAAGFGVVGGVKIVRSLLGMPEYGRGALGAFKTAQLGAFKQAVMPGTAGLGAYGFRRTTPGTAGFGLPRQANYAPGLHTWPVPSMSLPHNGYSNGRPIKLRTPDEVLADMQGRLAQIPRTEFAQIPKTGFAAGAPEAPVAPEYQQAPSGPF